MPEYNTVKIRKESYEIAKKWAEKQGESIADVISRSIENYVKARKDLEERARLLIKLLDEDRAHEQV